MSNQFRQYRDFQKGEFILAFADTAVGGHDYCACQFLSQDQLDVPLVFHSQVSATLMTPALHLKLEEIYDITGVQPCIAYERNNGGQFELERLSVLNKNQKYYIYEQRDKDGQPNGKLGWDTNAATRPKMLQELQECINAKLITLYDEPTVNELFSFIISKSGKPEAEKSAHDDLVMSLAGVWQLYQSESKPQKIDYTQFSRSLPDQQLFSRNGLF
ncbi:hypothetical protein IJJ08_03780 [bacterium]|nr:hypothetical protein [bacterium]